MYIEGYRIPKLGLPNNPPLNALTFLIFENNFHPVLIDGLNAFPFQFYGADEPLCDFVVF